MNTLAEAQLTIPADDFSFDKDIRDIFIDEAVEVLQEMDVSLPKWTDDPNDFTPLTEIRRGFHTLKGSGRMVGAFAVGETAWSVENLLNRVLDKKVPVTEELVSFVNEAKLMIPYLVNDFANGDAPTTSPAAIILQAENLRLQRDINCGLDDSELLDTNANSLEEATLKEVTVAPVETPTPVANKAQETVESIYEDASETHNETNIVTNHQETYQAKEPDIMPEVHLEQQTESEPVTNASVSDQSVWNEAEFSEQLQQINQTDKSNPVVEEASFHANSQINSQVNAQIDDSTTKQTNHNANNSSVSNTVNPELSSSTDTDTIDLSSSHPSESHTTSVDSSISDGDNRLSHSDDQSTHNPSSSGLLNKQMFFFGLGIGLLVLLFLLM